MCVSPHLPARDVIGTPRAPRDAPVMARPGTLRDAPAPGDAPRALLSYNDVVSMKPSSKGRHDMGNKEWGKFAEEAKEWFLATRMPAFPQTNQTRLMETVLDPTLLSRS